MKRREIIAAVTEVIEACYRPEFTRYQDALMEIGRILNVLPSFCKCKTCNTKPESERCVAPCSYCESLTGVRNAIS